MHLPLRRDVRLHLVGALHDQDPVALRAVRRLHDLHLLHSYKEEAPGGGTAITPRVSALSLCAENHHTFVGTEDGGLSILANPMVNLQVLEAIAGELLNL